jgi:hypothetical protein
MVCRERSCIFDTVDMTSSEPEEVVVCVCVCVSEHNALESKIQSTLQRSLFSLHTHTPFCHFYLSSLILLSTPLDFIPSSSLRIPSRQSVPPVTIFTSLILSSAPVICVLHSFPLSPFLNSPLTPHLLARRVAGPSGLPLLPER